MAPLTHLLAQGIWRLPEALTDNQRYLYASLIVLGAFVLILGLVPVLQTLPPRGRRAVIVTVTFLAGLFFAAEFFLPVDWRLIFPADDPTRNFLTPAIQRRRMCCKLSARSRSDWALSDWCACTCGMWCRNARSGATA